MSETAALSVLAAAREHPDRPFLVTAHETFCFAGVAERVRAIIAGLQHLGIQTGDTAPVAFRAENDTRNVLLLLALAELGVPAMPLSPRWSESERSAALSTAPVRWLEAPPEAPARVGPDPEGEHHATHLGLPVLVVHTSGSEGKPRGVLIGRRALLAAAAASEQHLGWQPDDRWLISLPLWHIAGAAILFRCLAARKCLALGELPAALQDAHPTLLSLVPTQLHRLLEDSVAPPRRLRAVLVGGAALPAPLLERARTAGWPALATYGATETCGQVATQAPGAFATDDVGMPLVGVELRIARGLIQIRSETLASGYFPNQPLPRDAEGWYTTRDRGELRPDGTLRVLGRADDVVVSGGENVDPLEVETALLEHPEITAACVFALPDQEFGERVAAVLVTRKGALPRDLGSHLTGRLAGFKRPRLVAVAAELPLGASGKVDRKLIASRFRTRCEPL